MKIVVYTAIVGNIDRLWSALPGTVDLPHIAFVDHPKTEAGLWGGQPPRILPGTESTSGRKAWEQRIIEPQWDSRRTARHYKALPHRYLPDADVWIWVDGNVRARAHPLKVLARYPDADLITYKHWDRRCLYTEAAFCAKIGKDKAATLNAQTRLYRKAGMPANWGLPATRVVIRRNTPVIRELNEAWWAEMERWSYRDQVSLPYVCWKLGIRWAELPGKCVAGSKGEFLYVTRHHA